MIVTFVLEKLLRHLRHDLIRDGLHRRLSFSVVPHHGFLFRRHRTGNTRTPFRVVAQFTLLEAVARVGNAETLFDLEQILKLAGRHGIGRFADLRSH